MVFISLLIFSAFSLASTAAYFSVVGLASIFTGSFWPIVIMGSALEMGKLMAASFLYRYWKVISIPMKSYLTVAIVVLMLITSAGIFGMLSKAYQQDSLPLKQIDARITSLQQEEQTLQNRKKQIDEIIASISPNYITKRMEQQKKFDPEENRINKRLPEITKEIRSLTEKKINQEVHTGPIVYLAKIMGKNIDDASAYMMYLIMFVFDPLAVTLTIGANIAVLRYTGKPRIETPTKEKIIETLTEVDPDPEPTEPEKPAARFTDPKKSWEPHNHTF